MSSPRSPLDLNLGPPNSVNDGTSAFRPFVLSTPTSIPTNDSVMENPITALRAASHLLTPRDQEFLARRPDHISADESLRLTIQSAASVMNLRHRLLARGVEVESLCGQIATLQQQLQQLTAKIERLKEERSELKRENKALKEEHSRLCLMVNKYQKEMKAKLDTLQSSEKRLEVEQRRLVSSAPNVSSAPP